MLGPSTSKLQNSKSDQLGKSWTQDRKQVSCQREQELESNSWHVETRILNSQ